jgi:protein-tyrosine phosphatase
LANSESSRSDLFDRVAGASGGFAEAPASTSLGVSFSNENRVKAEPFRVLFVCTGNICRSPTAEGVFAKKVADAGLAARIIVDSAGTHGYHVGEPPDARTQRAARARGYDLSTLRARRVEREDFERFDLVLAMDNDNCAFLARLCPPSSGRKLKLMMEYARNAAGREVPDPYGGGPEGFEVVLTMLEDATEGLLLNILNEQGVKR